MSDDLKARLRAWSGTPFDDDAHQSADLIEQLERELYVTNACNRGLVRLNEATQTRAEAAENALTQSLAETAAAYERAADACADYPRVAPDYDEWTRYDEQIEHSQKCIRALVTPEQSAALDAVIAEKLKENAKGIAEPCPCTLIEQDESCPVGYPSLLCSICQGTGNATPEKITALACEMLKIASDLGETEDPFAAWEVIASMQEEAQLCEAIKAEARARMHEASEIVSGPIWRLILHDEGCIDRPCHSESDLCECRAKHARILAAIQKKGELK